MPHLQYSVFATLACNKCSIHNRHNIILCRIHWAPVKDLVALHGNSSDATLSLDRPPRSEAACGPVQCHCGPTFRPLSMKWSRSHHRNKGTGLVVPLDYSLSSTVSICHQTVPQLYRRQISADRPKCLQTWPPQTPFLI